jgi:hypothetical protein
MFHLEEKESYKLFCDMDGVLVDFDRGYFELTGVRTNVNEKSPKGFWAPISKAGKSFWSDLHWTKDGKELWNYIEKYNPTILSAPSLEHSSIVGKHEWIDKHLPGVHLILRSAKHKHELSGPNHILIDDKVSTIESWNAAGGIGILHTSAEETIEQLKALNL